MKDSVTTLTETIPMLSLQMDATKKWTITNDANGWYDAGDLSVSGLGNDKFFVYQNEIDVSGWGNQGLSFFPMQAGVQEGYAYTYLVDDTLQVIDLITDSPLDVGQYIQANLQAFPSITLPALLEQPTANPEERIFPPLGWENILYGNSRLLQHNDNLQGLIVLPIHTNDFGSMNPTATDKLYITRIVSCQVGVTAQTGGFSYTPPTRFIIKGMLKSESDLSYIYRLKDSFKTTQTDVGYHGL